MPRSGRGTGLNGALRYRGGEGMWAWMLHRVTGLGVLLFLLIHIFDTALVIYSPRLYDHALEVYQTPVFRFAELAVFFGVVFHGLNGLRIIVQDFWPATMRRQRQLAWAVGVIVALTMVPVTWIMIAPLFGWAEEPGAERHRRWCVERVDAAGCKSSGSGKQSAARS